MRDHYTKIFLRAAGEDVTKEKINQYKALWWFSTRGKDSGGLRLTSEAIEYIQNQSQIKTYKIDLPKEYTITPQVLIWLDQYIESPFYLEKRYITVLSEKAAFELYLFSGDIKKYGLSKSLHKRLTQDLSV